MGLMSFPLVLELKDESVQPRQAKAHARPHKGLRWQAFNFPRGKFTARKQTQPHRTVRPHVRAVRPERARMPTDPSDAAATLLATLGRFKAPALRRGDRPGTRLRSRRRSLA